VSGSSLAYASIRGLLEPLDPHSSFIDPAEYAVFQESLRGSLFGIGVVVGQPGGALTIVSTMDGAPAQCAGLEPGDALERVDSLSTAGASLDDCMNAIRGPAGTWVSLRVRRPGVDAPFTRIVKRGQVPLAVVPDAFLLEPGTGYVRLLAFSQTAAAELASALRLLERRGMRRLVLDLRDNTGGLLSQARATAELFLASGERIYSARSARDEDVRYVCRGASWYPPLVVLVNAATASSAEVLTGALQDHDRALVVGVPTYGKGLIQQLYDLRDGSSLKLTIAKYYTPSGRCLQREWSDRLAYGSLEEGRPGDHDDEASLVYDAGEFRTDAGRGLPANGGVVPDFRVPIPERTRFADLLEERQIFFELALAERRRGRPVPEDLAMDDSLRAAFFRLVDGKPDLPFAGRARETYEKEPDRGAIDRAIRGALVELAHGRQAAARVRLEGDPQLLEALRRLTDASVLAAEYEERIRNRPQACPPGG
jgi:carboxyl-terminal processing protease